MNISVVIPCYNESEKIVDLIELIHSLTVLSEPYNFNLDFILVDNGCTDDTFDKFQIEALIHLSCCQIQTLHISQNIGYGYGVKSGLMNVRDRNVCILPADGKYESKDIIDSIALFSSTGSRGILVKGMRTNRNDPMIIRILSFIYTQLVNFLTGVRMRDVNGLPKIFFNGFSPNEIDLMSNSACLDATLLFLWSRKGGFTTEFPVKFTQNLEGKASWSGKRTVTTIKMFQELVRTTLSIRKGL